jgi:hypothetical protein
MKHWFVIYGTRHLVSALLLSLQLEHEGWSPALAARTPAQQEILAAILAEATERPYGV